MNRRTIFYIIGGAVMLHIALFIVLANKGLPEPRQTEREPNHFDHLAVRVQDEDGQNYIVRQYTVSTDLADPTPQFADQPPTP